MSVFSGAHRMHARVLTARCALGMHLQEGDSTDHWAPAVEALLQQICGGAGKRLQAPRVTLVMLA